MPQHQGYRLRVDFRAGILIAPLRDGDPIGHIAGETAQPGAAEVGGERWEGQVLFTQPHAGMGGATDFDGKLVFREEFVEGNCRHDKDGGHHAASGHQS